MNAIIVVDSILNVARICVASSAINIMPVLNANAVVVTEMFHVIYGYNFITFIFFFLNEIIMNNLKKMSL